MRNKPWTDEAWLTEHYVKRKMTVDQIAEMLKQQGISVTGMTVYNHLDKFNLIRNKRSLGKRKVGGNGGGKSGKGYYG